MKNFIILALACSLFACNSENSGLPTQVGGNYQPESFNFHEILSVDGNVKTYFFEWEDSSNASYYTLCEKSNSYKDNCNIIQDNLKGLSTQYELSRLLTPKFLDKEFFIIARNGKNIKLSNVRSVNQDEYLKSIGVVKSSNAKDNDYFGRSVSFSEDGNTLSIGAFGVDGLKGKVYIYQKKDNLWEQRVELSPDDLEAGDRFGISNAISKDGKTLVVGADHHNYNPLSEVGKPGKAYVYYNVADSWVFDRILTRGVNDDSFGLYISISDNGSTIAIASPGENNDIGNVYLYTNDGEVWSDKSLAPSHTDPYGPNRFGSSVSLSSNGNVVAIGAVGESSDSSHTNLGGVYIFKKQMGNWEEKTRLELPSTISGQQYHFGKSVSLDNTGATLAIGSPEEGSLGAVYIFKESNDSWSQVEKVQHSSLQNGDLFGYRVKLSGDANSLIIGAFTDNSGDIFLDDNLVENSGAVYFYKKENNLWFFDSYIKSPKNQKGGHFGLGLDISDDGSQMFIGARKESSGEGKVYLY
ncbi:hypothetical protein [Aliivibrio sifiae]|uniref:Integrin n=1 Tax=Aliivibrio sifiae TaxID=566293 RepID=A0A2S7X1W1_9GAMM|nr:hypothetical protein [Aliivibrio sifiae]PQJ84173.1 hypothetical protein BTO22_11485 [Aliivibrio sifiae]